MAGLDSAGQGSPMQVVCPDCGSIFHAESNRREPELQVDELDLFMTESTPTSVVEEEVAGLLNTDIPRYPAKLWQNKWGSPIAAMLDALTGGRKPTLEDADELCRILRQVYAEYKRDVTFVAPASFQQLAGPRIRAHREGRSEAMLPERMAADEDGDYTDWQRRNERQMKKWGDVIQS